MKDPEREIVCTEVWGGTEACEVSVKLAGVRGEVYSRPYEGGRAGGDIHFLSVCGMNILSKVVLADVSGHGEEIAEASQVIHQALVENIGAHDNSSMLRRVNDAFLKRRTGKFRFTTMVAMIVDNRDRSLVYAYAGHPSILHGRRREGSFEVIRPAGGPPGGIPLGVLPGTRYEQHALTLSLGDIIVVYTDAFTEAPAPGGGFLGEEGLLEILGRAHSMEPAVLKEHLLGEVGRGLKDDASLVILEVL